MAKKKEMEIVEDATILDDKGFAFMYNLTMVCGVATVALFVIGTAIYLAAVS